MTTLYEIADQRQVLNDWLLESEGEVTPELEALMAECEGDETTKIERVALYIREQKSAAEAVKIERDRLAALVKKHENAATSLTAYMAREMDRLGRDKVTGVLVTVAFQNNPPSVKGELVEELLAAIYANGPAIVKLIPASYQLDRKAALQAHKAGQALPEGLMVEQTRSLRIR